MTLTELVSQMKGGHRNPTLKDIMANAPETVIPFIDEVAGSLGLQQKKDPTTQLLNLTYYFAVTEFYDDRQSAAEIITKGINQFNKDLGNGFGPIFKSPSQFYFLQEGAYQRRQAYGTPHNASYLTDCIFDSSRIPFWGRRGVPDATDPAWENAVRAHEQ